MRYPAFEQPQPPGGAERGEIDMIALFREVGRRKWLVAAVTIGALALSTIAVNVMKPRYTAETRVFLENRETEYTRIGRDGARASDPLIDQDAVLSQVQLIQSRDIARAMIRRFDLGAKPEFDDVLNGVDAVTKFGVLLGLLNNPASMSPEERVLEKYFDKLKAFSVAKSRVLAIEFQSRDPDLAAGLSDAIADEYIRALEMAKKGSAKAAGTWLGRSIETLRERVATAEAKVEAYRNLNGLFLVGAGADGGSITAQQLSELNTQLATARSAQSELASKARIIREAIRQGRLFEVSEVVNNEVVRRLLENRATLKALISQEERTLLPQHPRIKELNGQLAGLEGQIRSAADRTARTLDNDARAAGARVAASQAELDLQKRASGAANEQEVQLRALERDAKAERDQLETYLGRYRDALSRDADNAVAADARIVSRAIVPSNPSFPKRLPIILVATFAGLAVSLFWILTRALLSDAIYARRGSSGTAPVAEPWSMSRPYAVTIGPAPDAAAEPASPAPMSDASTPPLSEASLAMRQSLARMTQAIGSAGAPSVDPPPVDPPLAAPPLAPSTEDIAARADRSLDVAPDDESNPLFEVAEEAEAALIRGRPVSVLILAVESARDTRATMTALQAILARHGPVAIAAGGDDLAPDELRAVMRACAGGSDYLLFDGGIVGPRSAALSRAATLTVLVASDDLADTRVEAAGHHLPGCNYFIVGAESSTSPIAV